MDMNELRAKVAALPTEPSGDVYLEDVLALFPAPQETAGEAVDCPACNGSFLGCWKCTYGKTNPTPAATPTDTKRSDDTALVEALREIRNMGQSAEPDHWKFRCHARDVARAALSSHDVVPTPLAEKG